MADNPRWPQYGITIEIKNGDARITEIIKTAMKTNQYQYLGEKWDGKTGIMNLKFKRLKPDEE